MFRKQKLNYCRCLRRFSIRLTIRLCTISLIAFPGSVLGQATIFNEAFEGTFPSSSWTIGDLVADYGQDYWGKVTCRKHFGSYSVWCSTVGATKDSLCNYYDFGMEAYMDSVVIPLSHSDGSPMYTNVVLSFWTWIENNEVALLPDDGLWVYTRESGGAWQLAASFESQVHDWTKTSVNINGYDDIQLRFMFKSYSNTSHPAMEGAYVDDILITGCPVLTEPTPVFPRSKDIVCGDRPVSYRWSAVPDASSYTIAWYDAPPDVSMPLATGIATGTNYVRSLPDSGTRYWRVHANGPCGSGPWSSTTRIYLYPTHGMHEPSFFPHRSLSMLKQHLHSFT